MGRAGRTVYPTARYRRERARRCWPATRCAFTAAGPAPRPTISRRCRATTTSPGLAVAGWCRHAFAVAAVRARYWSTATGPANGPQREHATDPVTPAAATVVEPAGFDVDDPVWDVPWLDELRDVPADATWPRLMTAPHPRAVGSYGADVAELRPGARPASRCAGGSAWSRPACSSTTPTGRWCWDDGRRDARPPGRQVVAAARAVRCGASIRATGSGEPQLVVHTGKDLAVCVRCNAPARTLGAGAARRCTRCATSTARKRSSVLADGSRWMVRAKEAVYGLTRVDGDRRRGVGGAGRRRSRTGSCRRWSARRQPQLLLVSTAHRKATALMVDRGAAPRSPTSTGDRRPAARVVGAAGRRVDDDGRVAAGVAALGRRTRERLIAQAARQASTGESPTTLTNPTRSRRSPPSG